MHRVLGYKAFTTTLWMTRLKGHTFCYAHAIIKLHVLPDNAWSMQKTIVSSFCLQSRLLAKTWPLSLQYGPWLSCFLVSSKTFSFQASTSLLISYLNSCLESPACPKSLRTSVSCLLLPLRPWLAGLGSAYLGPLLPGSCILGFCPNPPAPCSLHSFFQPLTYSISPLYRVAM